MPAKKWDEKVITKILKRNKNKSFSWFQENLPNVVQWCAMNGGIRYWREKVGLKVRTKFTEENVLAELKENIDKNANWFKRYKTNLVNWCENNGGWDNWKAKVGIKDKEKLTEEFIMEVLQENKDQNFEWFKENYIDIVRFCVNNGGWREWAKKAGVTTVSKIRNEETILDDLKKYRDKEDLTYTWLIENEPSLVRWCYRNGGLKYWVAKAGLTIKKKEKKTK